MKQRPPQPIAPTHSSQLTCLGVHGIDERRFLERIVPRCEHVAHVGRLRVVPVAEVERALRELEAEGRDDTAAPSAAATAAEPAELTEDEILHRLGRRRIAAGAR